MEGGGTTTTTSLMKKARTAFHTAAAKAERVLTDLKSDFHSPPPSPYGSGDNKQQQPSKESKIGADGDDDQCSSFISNSNYNGEEKHTRWRPGHIGTKQDWQERFKNIRIGKRGAENQTDVTDNSNMAVPFLDENLYMLNMKADAEAKASRTSLVVERLKATNPDAIPTTLVMKQLATAIEAGKKYRSMKDLLVNSGSSSPVRERAGLSLAAVKSLVLRDKDDKLMSEFGNDEKVSSMIQLLFNAEGNFLRRNINSVGCDALSLPRDIHGAPPESFLIKLAEVIGSFKSMLKMAVLWCKIVSELRKLWIDELHIPGIPLDEIPDLNSCLLHQQLQVINCCVSRKRRHSIATESMDSIMRDASASSEESAASNLILGSSPILYARVSSGELVLRLGADHPADGLTMLETSEPIYSPITQEEPLLTEDVIKETEEFVLRTGSVGAGCSQLLSDMQAFKAANPGCILEDFVRWHSPPDWMEGEASSDTNETCMGTDSSSAKGQLSSRMQKEGNLWRELWETAKPIPAVKQTPLFDEDLAVEGILSYLEDVPPSELFEQLFFSLLGFGFVMAEAKLSNSDDLLKLFNGYKEYIIITCQGSSWNEKLDDLCKVYESVEMMLLNPGEVMKMLKQTEEPTAGAAEPKWNFKRLSLNFGGKDKNLKKTPSGEEKNSEDNQSRQPFASFFDSKSSLFSKRPPKPKIISTDQTQSSVENDWTLV